MPNAIGSYKLGEKIGEGGMGAVFRCKSTQEDQPEEYAIKLLPVAHLITEEQRRDFLQECKALESVQHPHVLELHDYGIEDGVPFLVTELCTERAGEPFSLATIMNRRADRAMETHVLNRIFPQVIWALAFIHQRGMVHGDIKPENVLVQENNIGQLSAKLGDFGLASVTADPDYICRPLWAENEPQGGPANKTYFSGTYDYMSPEQLNSQPLDARSDVYSFGVMLYRAATGYDRVTFRRPSQIVEELPDWVDRVVSKTIVEDKEIRCENSLEMLFLLPENLRPAGVERSHAY